MTAYAEPTVSNSTAAATHVFTRVVMVIPPSLL